jgi:predicted small lipoprotein YifL
LIGSRPSSLQRRRFVLAAVAALGVALAACGRNGDPLPPPDASATPAKSADSQEGGIGGMGRPSNPPIEPPKRPFFLDFLL